MPSARPGQEGGNGLYGDRYDDTGGDDVSRVRPALVS
jgi:hypothetical protein